MLIPNGATMLPSGPLVACRHCGLIQRQPTPGSENRPACERCGVPLNRLGSGRRGRQRTLAAAVAALVLYFPAIALPMLEIRRLGYRHTSSLLSGTWDLLTHGEWFVGLVVFLFSVVLPIVKIALLLELSLLEISHRRHRAATYRLMEHLGKWSMMDVLLVALLVMLIKVGNLIEFQVGPAVWAFGLCVVMSMVASMSFDPYSIWDEA
ncbi:MAG: paraquat-inducible protein A [Pirellulaceae bacterium]